MPLMIDLQVGDTLEIGDEITVRLVRKADRERGGRLSVDAPRTVHVRRIPREAVEPYVAPLEKA